jgi:hypothetical protein
MQMLVRLLLFAAVDLYHLYVAAGVVEAENNYNYLAYYLAYVFYIIKIYSVYIKISCLPLF